MLCVYIITIISKQPYVNGMKVEVTIWDVLLRINFCDAVRNSMMFDFVIAYCITNMCDK